MDRRDLFRTTLFASIVDDSAWREALLADIAAWRSEHPETTVRSSYGGAWHSPTDAFKRPAFRPLVRAAVDAATAVFRRERYLGHSRARVDSMWANVNPPGAYHVPHTHGGVLWAGVYYARLPAGSPPTVLLDPRGGVGMNRPVLATGQQESDRHKESAEAGKMILFPGWLQHYVEPHEGEGDRITVSFNVRQIIVPKSRPLLPERRPDTPRFALAPALLTPAECARSIEAIAAEGHRWGEARVGRNARRPEHRNGDVMFLRESDPEWAWLYGRIRERAAAVNAEHFGVDIAGGVQPIQAARYAPGEFYGVHTDRGGEMRTRSLSCVIALRPAERGGGTSFPEAPAQPPAQGAGDAIFFRGDEPHTAEPVEAGERLTLVVWLCESDQDSS